MEPQDEIRIVLSKRQLRAALVLALVAGGAYFLFSESFTLSTYYPAPSGIYSQMVTTGNTYLARDSLGKVGIGTTNPGAKLDVTGGANVSATLTAAQFSGSGAGLTNLPWSSLAGYPPACPFGQFVSAVAGALTCAPPPAAGGTGQLSAGGGISLGPNPWNPGGGSATISVNVTSKVYNCGGNLSLNSRYAQAHYWYDCGFVGYLVK